MNAPAPQWLPQVLSLLGPVAVLVIELCILGLMLLIWVAIPGILFVCAGRVPPQHQKIQPALVWLLLIPCFSAIWGFFVYLPLSLSLKAFYEETNQPGAGDCGYNVGLAYCILKAVGTFGCVLFFIPCLGALIAMGLAVAQLVALIVYLVTVWRLSAGVNALAI